MKKDLLGILINDSLWEGIRKNKTGHERLEFYQMAGEKFSLIPAYFRLKDISLNQMSASALLNRGETWEDVKISLPKVIHNRAILHTTDDLKKLRALTEQRIHIFNLWNRFGKLYISRLLEEKKAFHPYLPATFHFNRDNIQLCKSRFNSFLLKPDKGTVGVGIMKVDKKDDLSWKLQNREGNEIQKVIVRDRQLYQKLELFAGTQKYLVQETIPLATYQGSPFDIRVSVQKNNSGKWGVTGMVGKVARAGHFLCNVAQGGHVVTVEQICNEMSVGLPANQLIPEISQLALSFTEYLDRRLPHLADVGYDFGMDASGHLYFIEMNSRDQRYSFAKANLYDAWKKTYENPVGYARYLLDKKGKES